LGKANKLCPLSKMRNCGKGGRGKLQTKRLEAKGKRCTGHTLDDDGSLDKYKW